eukprot:6737300-Ditylum_brightwellii.AAC.1
MAIMMGIHLRKTPLQWQHPKQGLNKKLLHHTRRSPQQTPAAKSTGGSSNKTNNKTNNKADVGISQENSNRGKGSGLGLEDADLYKNQQGEEGMYKSYPKDGFMMGYPLF